MNKTNSNESAGINIDQQQIQLKLQMALLQKNLHKIQEQYMTKINKLKQMNKIQNQKSLRLTKQILQLRKINQIQKEQIQKIVLMTKDQQKISTPRTIKKIASKQAQPRNPVGSPSTKAFGSSQRIKKSTEMFRKSTDLQTKNKIRKSVQLKKFSPKNNIKNISVNDKNQDSAKTTKNTHKIISQKFRQNIHVFK